MSKRGGLQTTIIVAMLGMLGPFAIDTIFPGFARIGVQFGVTDAALQQILSVYLLSFAIASLFHGPISDAVGRKPVMIVGLSAFVLASIGCALAPNLPVLLGMRVLQGASAGAGQIISRALVRDLYSGVQAQRVMAQIAMIFGIAPAIAPVVGGWLLAVGNWPVIFVFLALYATLLIVVVMFGLPETHPASARTPVNLRAILGGLVLVGRSGAFLRLAFASSLGFSAQFLYIAGAPIMIVRLLGLGERDFWMLFFPMISGMVLGSWTNSRLAAWGRPMRLASIGFGFMLVSAVVNVVVAAAVGPSMPWAVIGPPITAFGVALTFPVLQLHMLDMFPARRGAAASLQSFATLLLNALVAGVIVPMVSGSVLTMALTSAGFAVGAVALWTWHVAASRDRR